MQSQSCKIFVINYRWMNLCPIKDRQMRVNNVPRYTPTLSLIITFGRNPIIKHNTNLLETKIILIFFFISEMMHLYL